MSFAWNRFALAATLLAAAAPAAALPDGDRMIAQCLSYAAAQKLTPLSVAVIDASGALVAFKRQPGASAVSAEVALLKARTAARLNLPTSVLGEVSADAGTRDAFLLLELTTIAGGVPLADERGAAAGAVGVSGAAPEQDAECARRAAEPVKSR